MRKKKNTFSHTTFSLSQQPPKPIGICDAALPGVERLVGVDLFSPHSCAPSGVCATPIVVASRLTDIYTGRCPVCSDWIRIVWRCFFFSEVQGLVV